MSGRKAAPERAPRVHLVPLDDGYRAVWTEETVRYLLTGGAFVDVVTSRDDSELRGVIVDGFGSIAGSTILRAPAPVEPVAGTLFEDEAPS